MTIEDVSKLVMEKNPRNLKDIKALGIKVRPLGSGAYRYVYKVSRLPLVLKIPIDHPSSRKHSEEEIKVINSIKRLKKYRKLRKYLPTIYFYNPTTRIIGMEYYDTKSNPTKNAIADLLCEFIGELCPELESVSIDLHRSNIAFDSAGQIKIIDLGYFTERGRGWCS